MRSILDPSAERGRSEYESRYRGEQDLCAQRASHAGEKGREREPRRSSIARVDLPHSIPSRPGPSYPSYREVIRCVME